MSCIFSLLVCLFGCGPKQFHIGSVIFLDSNLARLTQTLSGISLLSTLLPMPTFLGLIAPLSSPMVLQNIVTCVVA